MSVLAIVETAFLLFHEFKEVLKNRVAHLGDYVFESLDQDRGWVVPTNGDLSKNLLQRHFLNFWVCSFHLINKL